MAPWIRSPEIIAFDSVAKASKYTKERFGVEFALLDDVCAQVSSYVSASDSNTVCVVAFVDPYDYDLPTRVSFLAHECTHIAQRWAEQLGEKKLSDEMEACAVESAMRICIKQLGAKRFLRPKKEKRK